MILENMLKITELFKSLPIDSQSLEARFVSGDMNAIAEIMQLHQTQIYQLGLRLFSSREQAADFYQDVFIRVFEKRHHYNPARPLKPWLLQVALNLGRDRLRRKREITTDPQQLPESIAQPAAEDNLLQDDVRNMVWQAMQQLSPNYREILALRFSSDLSLKEIAATLQISLSAAKVRLCRGLQAFETACHAQGGAHHVL